MKYMKDNMRIFIDSNIWIYFFLNSEKDFEKNQIAKRFLKSIVGKNQIILSTQVINEYHWTLYRKYKIDEEIIRSTIDDKILTISDVVTLSTNNYNSAFDLRKKYSISFWDSLILASALENNCEILYSEDMQHNQIIENKLKIINPFENAN